MKKVLWISNYGYGNSYCFVTKTLLSAFLQKYPDAFEMYLFCIGQTQHADFAERVSKEIGLPIERIYFTMIYTSNFDNPEDKEFMKNHVVGITGLKQIYDAVKPDLTISLNDDSPLVLQKKMADLWDIPFVPYLTHDKDFLGEKFAISEYKFPAVITPSKATQKIFKERFDCPVHVLPHIVDTIKYHQLDNKGELKEKWLGSRDVFVVVAVNRNNIRKRWDLLINAFELFAKDHPNARLLIKTDKYEVKEQFSSINAPQYNLDNYSHPQVVLIMREVSAVELLEIYNCGDVGLSTTSGEGFGLTPCEMSICKVPQLVPNNTSHPWIFGENYPGLIRCKQYASNVARSFMSLEKINADTICIFKSYIHYDSTPEINSLDYPVATSGIYTILLTNNTELAQSSSQRGIKVFGTVQKLLDYLDANIDSHPRLQVLLHTNLEYISGLDLQPLFAKKWVGRKNYIIAQNHLDAYSPRFGTTGLVEIEHVVELLCKCHDSPEFCSELAQQCYDGVMQKFTSANIVNQMKDLLTKLTLPPKKRKRKKNKK